MYKSTKLIFGLIIMMVLVLPNQALAVPSVVLNGKQLAFDVPPFIENDRTLVPMSAIFTALGAQISWNEDTQTVTAVKDNVTFLLTIDNKTAYKNGQLMMMDVMPRKVRDRTMVPLAFVGSALGQKVAWDENTQTATITSPEPTSAHPLIDGRITKYIQNGEWKYVATSGDQYVGDIVDGLPDGRGIWTRADGSRYEGNFSKGLKNGYGEEYYAAGGQYYGYFLNDKYEGHGVLVLSDGTRFEGTWKNGMGNGIMTWQYPGEAEQCGWVEDNKVTAYY